jgi:hypothetical protein
MGMTIQVLFDPEDWPHTRQHALIDAEVAKLYRAGRASAAIAAA